MKWNPGFWVIYRLWRRSIILADFPIELNLFNENTNYVEDRSKGKSCHWVRIVIENLLHSISIEKTNELYSILSMMGWGRQIIGFFMTGDKRFFGKDK